MWRTVLPLSVCFVLSLCFGMLPGVKAAVPQGDQDFTLVNQTNVTIHNVYVSPSASDDWEEDILGVDVLSHGDSVDISFSRKERAKYWDLKVSDGEGNSIVWTKLNLLEISKVTLYYRNGKATATVE
ncbi:MAG: hypothetical protein K1Y36_12805 [Blastocatellia bacterium]|nr:hypothetical protein [Blastocatellia bacterium]